MCICMRIDIHTVYINNLYIYVYNLWYIQFVSQHNIIDTNTVYECLCIHVIYIIIYWHTYISILAYVCRHDYVCQLMQENGLTHFLHVGKKMCWAKAALRQQPQQQVRGVQGSDIPWTKCEQTFTTRAYKNMSKINSSRERETSRPPFRSRTRTFQLFL